MDFDNVFGMAIGGAVTISALDRLSPRRGVKSRAKPRVKAKPKLKTCAVSKPRKIVKSKAKSKPKSKSKRHK